MPRLNCPPTHPPTPGGGGGWWKFFFVKNKLVSINSELFKTFKKLGLKKLKFLSSFRFFLSLTLCPTGVATNGGCHPPLAGLTWLEASWIICANLVLLKRVFIKNFMRIVREFLKISLQVLANRKIGRKLLKNSNCPKFNFHPFGGEK